MDPMEAIKQTFFQECDEQLTELETGLLAIEGGQHDGETINAVFRAVHSIKGGAGAFGLDDLVRFAHVFETSLDRLRSNALAPSPAILRVLLRAADALADLVGSARAGSPVDPASNSALVDALRAMAGEPPKGATDLAEDPDGMDGLLFQPVAAGVGGPDAPRCWTINFAPHPALYAKANEAALLIRELGRLGDIAVTLDAAAVPDLSVLDPEGSYLAWTVALTTDAAEADILAVFEFVQDDCELSVTPPEADPAPALPDIDVMALIAQAQAAPAVAEPEPAAAPAARRGEDPAHPARPTIRVDLDRVDRLIDLVGELVINQAMLAQRVLETGLERSSAVAVGLDDLEQLTRQIQDSVMAIRAQPVKSVFQRLPRLVREVAGMTGKQVRLVTEGEATEVDKTVIEHLSDPLTHMIRNAIDHGLESPERRLAAGKPAEGTVRIAALHRSGRIVIELSDDGGGIDRPRVRASAIAKGLLAADAVLDDEETDNLIFLPGFSTAETISDISGRGVGMDVVRRSIQALGGRISIASSPGIGSTFTLSLPLTLAVLDGMVVSVADETMIIPLTTIIETLQPRASDVHKLAGGRRVIGIRGQYVPLLDVSHMLGFRKPSQTAPSSVALLIEGEGGNRATLLVDAIQGQRQVVIKSLEANYGHISGVAAATIMGDGRVALILDVDALLADRGPGLEPAVDQPVLELADA